MTRNTEGLNTNTHPFHFIRQANVAEGWINPIIFLDCPLMRSLAELAARLAGKWAVYAQPRLILLDGRYNAPLHTIISRDWWKKKNIGNIALKPLKRKEGRPTLKTGFWLHRMLSKSCKQTADSISIGSRQWACSAGSTRQQHTVHTIHKPACGWLAIPVDLWLNHLEMITYIILILPTSTPYVED